MGWSISGEPASWRHKIHEEAGAGLTIEIWDIARKASLPLDPALWDAAPPALAALQIVQAAANPLSRRQVCLRLTGESALVTPGAFQSARGRISAELQRNAAAGGRLARRGAAAATGEAAYATRFVGEGEIWTHPSAQHFVTIAMDDADDALLIDMQAFYACEGSISVETHVHGSAQGLIPGNALTQSRLTGRGVLVMQCPVPPAEISVIELDDDDELTVQCDMLLACSAALEVTLTPLVRGPQNVTRSLESLVYTLRGRGKVLLMPTLSLGY